MTTRVRIVFELTDAEWLRLVQAAVDAGWKKEKKPGRRFDDSFGDAVRWAINKLVLDNVRKI